MFGLFAVVVVAGCWTLLAGRRDRAPTSGWTSSRIPAYAPRRESRKKQDAVSKMLEKASPLAKPLQPKTENEVGKLKQRLGYAGFRSEAAVSVFLGLKFIGLMVGLFVCGGPRC